MSANVWFEEMFTSLIAELKNTIKIKNEYGELKPLPSNAFTVRKPEEEFLSETFPCVSLYVRSYKFAPIRYNPSPVVVERSVTEGKVTLEDSAIPYDISVQIDFWSKYQTDMDSMIKSWLTTHFHQFVLYATDDGGTVRDINCLTQGSAITSDLISNGNRLFHSIINLQIWVELDSQNKYNKPMVVDEDINVGTR